MANPVRPFHDAQQQVVVLRSFVVLPESANGIEHVLANDRQVARVHPVQEQLGRPVRLERGIAPPPRQIEFVLVRVDERRIGMRVEPSHHLRQRVRRQFVIMVEERDVLAPRERHRGVRSRRDSLVGRQLDDTDTLVVGKLREYFCRSGRRRGVVAQAQFPIRIDLAADRFDTGPEPLRIRVEDRRDDADERLVGKGGHFGPEGRKLRI